MQRNSVQPRASIQRQQAALQSQQLASSTRGTTKGSAVGLVERMYCLGTKKPHVLSANMATRGEPSLSRGMTLQETRIDCRGTAARMTASASGAQSQALPRTSTPVHKHTCKKDQPPDRASTCARDRRTEVKVTSLSDAVKAREDLAVMQAHQFEVERAQWREVVGELQDAMKASETMMALRHTLAASSISSSPLPVGSLSDWAQHREMSKILLLRDTTAREGGHRPSRRKHLSVTVQVGATD